jgi:signal transduction histidine kinase
MRWTIRLRLTLLYGTLYLTGGAALLFVVYLMVAHTLPWSPVPNPKPPSVPRVPAGLGGLRVPTPSVGIHEAVARQRNADLRSLLTASGIALGLLAVLSVWLGWAMAGRVLRPLRAMADNARTISVTDLHRRLAAAGPDDELKDLADTFDTLLDHLQSAFEAQRRFVANASHELRTPLTFERSLLEITLGDPDASAAELREVCERVLNSNERQEKLIESLLTLARSQRGLDRRTPVDLAIIAGELLDLLPTADVRIEPDLEPATTIGDPALLERMIGNLVDNALRHNVPGGWVEVRTGISDGRPTLTVGNSGPQVEPDQIDRIFQPFQRLRPTEFGGHAGQGIGLSIVAAIVAAHDAELTAVPFPDGGLHIRIAFPPLVA